MPPKKTTPEHRSTELRADLNIHAHAPPSAVEQATKRYNQLIAILEADRG